MKKTLKYLLLSLTVYISLLAILVCAERQVPDSGIRTLPDAIWYSLVTLTTVGYGDYYPVSAAGKLVGTVFLICSMGLLAAVLGVFISFFTGGLGPWMRLFMVRKKHWYIIDGLNECTKELAADLSENKSATVIFCGVKNPEKGFIYVPYTAEKLARMKKTDLDIFLLAENEKDNFSKAVTLADKNLKIYCRTDVNEALLPQNVSGFLPFDAVARTYWKNFPVKDDRCIVISGNGKLLDFMLERAIMTNIVDHTVEYHVYGDDGSFLRHHYCLSKVLSIGNASDGKDSLIFEKGEPGDNPEILCSADRIILCDEKENFKNYSTLMKYYPISGKIHVYGEIPGAICFGKGIYTAENIMGTGLTALAMKLNEIYRAEYNQQVPKWENLSPFIKQSNIASADHLNVKENLLGFSGNPKGAYEAYVKKSEQEKRVLWELEHERWMRFYAVHNWKYGDIKDENKRTHPMMTDFKNLSYEDQKKDEEPWLLLGKVDNV